MIATVETLRPEECGPALLALNNEHAAQLSWLSPPRLHELARQAFLALRVGESDGLMIAFDQHAEYDSPNFRWFRDRHARFVYVDRVVVAANRRGLGLGRRLYRALDDAARRAGHDRIGCEINLMPRNRISECFHERLGFVPVGEGLAAPGKPVSYRLKILSGDRGDRGTAP